MLRTLIGAYRDAFGGLPRRVWLLAAVTLIHRCGTMVLPFLTLYLTIERGTSVRLAGQLLALYGLGSVLGAVLGGRLAERLGTVRAMQLTLVGAGVGFGALALITDLRLLAAVLFATSMAAEGFRTPSSADLGRSAPPAVRARAFALRRLAINLGMAIGPAVGGLLATVDYRWLFAVDGVTCLAAAAAVALWLVPRPDDDDAEARRAGQGSRGLWRDPVFVGMLAASVTMNVAFAQLIGTYPLTMKRDFRFSETVIGFLFATNTLLIVLFEMVLVHRLGAVARPLRTIATGSLILGAGLAMVPLDPRIGFAFLAVAVITLGEMLTHPLIEGAIANRVSEASLNRAMGVLMAGFSGTVVLAPILGTWVYDVWGFRALWLASGAAALLAAAGFLAVDRVDARRPA